MLDQIFRNMTPVVKNLLILNVLFFFAQLAFPFYMENLALTPIGGDEFRPWQLATHFFMHGGVSHIFFNMFALVFFGSRLEMSWGAKRFLIFYLVSAVGAAIIYSVYLNYEAYLISEEIKLYKGENFTLEGFNYLWSTYSNGITLNDVGLKVMSDSKAILNSNNTELYPYAQEGLEQLINLIAEAPLSGKMLGASGAVFGVLTAFGYLFPNTELMLLFFPVPIKAKYLVAGYIAMELYFGFANNPQDNVAHFAHIGGALIGFLLVLFWQKDKRNFY